jgi:putative ABC transport system permease protein
MVRYRFAGFAGTFLAVFLGVAVITVGTTLWVSARPELPHVYANADILVRAPAVADNTDGDPEYRPWTAADVADLTGRLAAVPGVAAAAADRPLYVQRVVGGRPVGDPTESLTAGHGWSAAVLGSYRLTSGAAPERDGAVAVDERLGLAVGAPMPVVTAEGPQTWTVSGTLTGGPDDGTGFAYFVADATAQRLASGVRVIGLRLTRDADAGTVATAARAAVGDRGVVLHGAERDALEPAWAARIRWVGAQLIIAMVFLGGFAAVFVVASTSAFTTALRRREIGLLRAVGATPGQVRRMLYGEAALVAVAAGAAGAGLGTAVAPLLAGPFAAAGLEPPGFEVRPAPVAIAAAFLTGMVVALLGVWSSARRTSRVPALQALRDAAVEKRPMTVLRWLSGVACLLAGLGLVGLVAAVAADKKAATAMASAMTLIVAAALLAPVLVVPVVRLVTWPFRAGPTALLVREGSVVAVRRVAATAAPVLVTVGLAVLIAGSFGTYEEGARLDGVADVPVANVLAPDNTPGLSEAAVRSVPGRSLLRSRVYAAGRDGVARGFPADGAADAPGLVVPAELGWAAGDAVPVRFADGVVQSMTVRAVAPPTEPGEHPVLALPRPLLRAHDPGALTPYVYLPDQVRTVTPVGGVVLSARAYVQREIDVEADLIPLFLAVLLSMSVGFTWLAVGNTLLLATIGRKVEFATLRQAGATIRQTLRVVVSEAVLAVAIGTGLGLVVAATALSGVASGLSDALAAPVGIAFPWPTTLLVTLACLLAAVVSTAVPVHRARG